MECCGEDGIGEQRGGWSRQIEGTKEVERRRRRKSTG